MAYPQTGKDRFLPLDLSFLNNGFYDDNKNLRANLLEKEARALAERFGPKGGPEKVSSAQMRRFFGDVRELESDFKRDLDMKSDDIEKMAPHIARVKMLKSKLAYASGRGVIPRNFALALSKAVDQVKTPKDFKAFVLFFESIVGYYYGEGGGKIR